MNKRITIANRIKQIYNSQSQFKKTMNKTKNKSMNKTRSNQNIKPIGKGIIYRKEKYKKGFINSVKTKTIFPYISPTYLVKK